MHIDARTLDDNAVLNADLCIVGAGAAGLSMAIEWEGFGSRVILLEGGGFDYEAKMQDLYKGTNTGLPYYALESARLHYFGGTTGHWAGFCSTLDELDFKQRSWVSMSGWPITKYELDPFYARGHKLLELGPYDYRPEYWTQKDKSLEPLPLDQKIIRHKIWQFSPPTRFGTKYRSTILNSSNINLYTYANVIELILNDNGSRISEVIISNHSGKKYRVRAKRFVLACCAIQNARLLLASNRQIKEGLGNQHDLVGRYFMEHIELPTARLVMPVARSLKLYMLEYFYTKARSEIGLTESMQEKLELLNGTISFSPITSNSETTNLSDTASKATDENLTGWKKAEDAFQKGEIPKKEILVYKEFEMVTRMEQAPNSSSRVTLSADKDELGVPRSVFNWALTAMERKSISKLNEVIGQQIGAAGIGRVKLQKWLKEEDNNGWPESLGGAWHHMGTTRMSTDPKKGVVDADCKVHGIENLFVAGSSCFPVSGVANPTLSTVALTLRLSDHLKQH